ncbi:MAG TPA: hypothetical protein VFE90_14190 [Myxococcales bacterium]|nr:hypothetical protein [Myxococcales bacterium]
MRLLAFSLCCAFAGAVLADQEPREVPINVPSGIPVGFLLAWKPSILSVRVDSGVGAQFGSDKFQPLRALGRWTTTAFGERFLARIELEGGQFQTDTQGTHVGSDGFDLTGRLLGGIVQRIAPGFNVTAAAGLITRYQWGTEAQGGAPRIGIFGGTSNVELEYRIAPVVTIMGYLEGALTPFPYAAQANLGVLSDSSEFKARIQLSIDIARSAAVDFGYDFTRWHATFTGSNALDPGSSPDKALLVESRDHALTLGIRWKP